MLMKICKQLLLPFLLLPFIFLLKGLFLPLTQQTFFKGPIQCLKSSSQGAQWQAPVLFEKKEKLAEMITRCHSLDDSLSLIVIYCHSLYHSLSFIVTRCHSLYHWLSLAVTRCTTRLPFYKRSAKRASVDHYSISLINFSLIIYE